MLQLVHHLANLNIQGDPRIAMEPEHDPLVAALPPATDYITYLTILEYTLKPSNIATLNRLLLQDDGTLAREIGWNLIDILVSLAPWMKAAGEGEEALRSCLNVIARRGNPRETVITVSATLEAWTGDARRFGGGADGEGDEEDEEIPGDEHPAFRGEADPIHLGSIRLDGMPDVNRRSGEGSANVTRSDQFCTTAEKEVRSRFFITIRSPPDHTRNSIAAHQDEIPKSLLRYGATSCAQSLSRVSEQDRRRLNVPGLSGEAVRQGEACSTTENAQCIRAYHVFSINRLISDLSTRS